MDGMLEFRVMIHAYFESSLVVMKLPRPLFSFKPFTLRSLVYYIQSTLCKC